MGRTRRALGAALLTLGVTAGGLLGAGQAGAAAPVTNAYASAHHLRLPAPRGAGTAIPLGVRTKLSGGVSVLMTERSVGPTAAQRARLPLAVTESSAYFCKYVTVYYYWGPSWLWDWEFQDGVGWCGNGHNVYSLYDRPSGPNVSSYGSLEGMWRSFGIYFGPKATAYYGGWAYTDFIEGKVVQCLPTLITCWYQNLAEFPKIQVNVYADGGSKGWSWE